MTGITNSATNSDQIMLSRYNTQQDASKNLTQNLTNDEAQMLARYLPNNNKPENDDLYLKAFSGNRTPYTLKYGYDHHYPMNQKVGQHFPLQTNSTGGGFGWLNYRNQYTLCGE